MFGGDFDATDWGDYPFSRLISNSLMIGDCGICFEAPIKKRILEYNWKRGQFHPRHV